MARQHSTTLLALVQAVNEYARSDDETVATIAYLINSGTVRLCGTFAGARIDLSPPASTAPTAPRLTATEEGSRGTVAALEVCPQPDTIQSLDYGRQRMCVSCGKARRFSFIAECSVKANDSLFPQAWEDPHVRSPRA